MTAPSETAPATPSTAQSAIARVLQNSIWLVAGQLISKVFTFGYILLLARYLGVETFGDFNLVVSFVMVADIATDFGLTRLVIRDLARDQDQLPHYLGVLLPLKTLLICGGYLLMLAIVYLLGYRQELVLLAAFAGLAMFPLGLGTLLDSACHARQRMQWSSLAQVALAISQALVGAAVLLAGGGIWAAIAVAMGANIIFLCVEIYAARRLGFEFHWSLQLQQAKRLLAMALPYAGVAVLGAVAARAELLILGWHGNARALGEFSVAMKFYEAAAVVPIMLASASTPALSKFHARDREGLGRLYRWTLSRVLALTVPAALGVCLLADLLVAWLFPPEYAQVPQLMRWVFLGFPFAAIYIVNGSFLLASDHARHSLGVSLAVVGLQVLLALVLIRMFSAQGAALAMLCTQVTAALVTTWLIARWYGLSLWPDAKVPVP